MSIIRREVSRLEFLKLSSAGVAGLALLGPSACSGGGQGATELTFGFGPDNAGGLQKLIDQFNRQYEGEIQVKWREMPASSAEYFEQLQSELQSGQATVDVIGGDVIWPAQFAAAGYLIDLSDRFTEDMKSDYLKGPVEAVTYQNRTWGVPWFTDAGMFYYRQDLLEGSGFSEPPTTWDEMKEMVRRVQADSGTKYGFVFQGAQDEGGVVDALEHIWNAGGDVLAGNEVVINSPQAIEGLTARRSMIEDDIAPQETGDYTTQESQSVFTNGDAVFMRNWPFVYGLLSNEKESSVRPEQAGVAPLPVSERGNESSSGLGGWNFLVNAASEDKLEEAWTFIEFMVASGQQKEFALESSRLPTLKSLYEDDEVLEKVPVANLGRDVIQNARPRPVSPYYSDMSLRMATQFNDCVKGDITPQQAVETLEEELQTIVRQS
ncbi:MAG: ABC transporter substrate-binding protein [Actinomycetota bacterium]|nr:ABC transporter substrate-binding protein [Actinomycetota bacterium]